ncbi:MAG: AAA family ATPase, partial [Candidatus Gracilibacteria bacterium]|nr:AAA family ATPase [Candidatus Gracilibacteria bacterium]
VEANTEEITRIEKQEMQDLLNNDIKNTIKEAITQTKLDEINRNLDTFINTINDRLSGYAYKPKGLRKNILMPDLIEKIIEVYFSKRILTKAGFIKSTDVDVPADVLSSGEKKKALIDLASVLLTNPDNKFNKNIILGIDEPEASLHVSSCFEQFEKLKKIGNKNQILITTHWYGFLPILGEGIANFLYKKIDDQENEVVLTESYDLLNYREKIKQDSESSKNELPHDYYLKSINDLVQSIFYSIQDGNSYNWIICEGLSEKKYFEFFFQDQIKNNNLIILPVGSGKWVVKLFKYLYLPISENKSQRINGKIFCLIDTDSNSFGKGIENNGCDITGILKIQRLANKNDEKTSLMKVNQGGGLTEVEIENALNPIIFYQTIMHFIPGLS